MSTNLLNTETEVTRNPFEAVRSHPHPRTRGRLIPLLLLVAWSAAPGRAGVINFEDLTAGAPGGAGGPSVVLSNQYINSGLTFQNAQGFDYSRGAFPPGFAHSGSKAIEPWASAWSDWAGLGGTALQPGVAVAANPADTREVFVLGGDGSLYGGWRSTDPSVSYLLWEWLQAPAGVQFEPVPVVGRNADGRREVFALGNDGVLYHKFETSVGGGWSAWYSLGGWQMQGPIGVATNADGRLEVYVRGGDNEVYSANQTTPNGSWCDLSLVGATSVPVKAFSVTPNLDGRLEIVAVGQDGVLYDIYQGAPNAGWSDWISLAGWNLRGAVALGCNADGRLEGFVVGSDGVVYRKAQLSTGIGSWTDWSSMAHAALSNVTNVTVNSLKDGRLFLVLRQADGTLFYRAQVAPNGGWGDPVALGGADVQWPVTLARDPDGRLELWAIGNDGQVHNRRMGTLYPNDRGYVQPLAMQFTRPQRELRLWAGYSASPGNDTRGVLRGFDELGQEITNTVAVLGPTISTPLVLTALHGNLVRATVGYLATEAGLGVNDGLAIDDVQGTARDDPPLLGILGVWGGLVHLRYNGPPNRFATLEGRPNWGQWSQIATFTFPLSQYDFTDSPPLGLTKRFYRLKLAGAFLQWQSLGGSQLQPAAAVGYNADGRREVFAVGGDGVLYDQWETSVGGPWSGWTSLGGSQMQGPVATATNADGRIEVYTLGGDRQIWFRDQNLPNCCWADWSPISIGGPPLKGYAVNANLDGRLEIIAVGQDGVLYDIYQGAPNQGWSVWLTLGGSSLRGPVALGRNADGRLEGLVVGGDGVVYRKAQSQTGIGSWTDWYSMAHASLSTITNLAVSSLVDGRMFLLLRQADGALFYRTQVAPNGGWGDPVPLGGTELQWPVSIGRTADGRLELWAVGTDGQVHNRAQVAVNQPDAWSDWTALGGTLLQPGLAVCANPAGELEVFVLGGDGALWRGWR